LSPISQGLATIEDEDLGNGEVSNASKSRSKSPGTRDMSSRPSPSGRRRSGRLSSSGRRQSGHAMTAEMSLDVATGEALSEESSSNSVWAMGDNEKIGNTFQDNPGFSAHMRSLSKPKVSHQRPSTAYDNVGKWQQGLRSWKANKEALGSPSQPALRRSQSANMHKKRPSQGHSTPSPIGNSPLYIDTYSTVSKTPDDEAREDITISSRPSPNGPKPFVPTWQGDLNAHVQPPIEAGLQKESLQEDPEAILATLALKFNVLSKLHGDNLRPKSSGRLRLM